MFSHVKSGIFLFVLLGLTTTRLAGAQAVIFDNFGAGDTYIAGRGATISGQNTIGGRVDTAMYFITPSGNDYSLDKIEMAITSSSGPNELDVALMTNVIGSQPDQAAGIPGSIIEMWHISNAMGPFGHLVPPVTVSSVSHPLLLSDTKYWIAAFAGDPDTIAVWNDVTIADTFRAAQRTSFDKDTEWHDVTGTGAFRISASVVPESSSAVLCIGLAPAALFVLRRRHTK